jgi:hypothetical protein
VSGVAAAARALRAAWDRLWFRPASTLALETVRVGTGLALLAAYATAGARVGELYGPAGWAVAHWWIGSSGGAWPWLVAYGVLQYAAAALAIGWRTRAVKWMALAGHLLFAHRAPALTYGLDAILANLVFVLCLAPVGRALALDARRGRGAPADTGPWGAACLRLIQLQLALMFLVTGLDKLRGGSWRGGYAVWIALTNVTFGWVPLDWLAAHFDVVRAATWLTVAFELAYPVLIWPRRTRPWILAGALVLHTGIAVMLGLWAFSLAMLSAHAAFLPWPTPQDGR